MKGAIISIGDELLIGQTVNTNASFIGEELTSIGVSVQLVLTISDKKQEIIQAMQRCQNEFELVVITGGLGPTKDDITKASFATYFGVPLQNDPKVLAQVRSFFESYKRKIQPVNELQALVPKGCKVLPNKVGTAPGMWMEKESTVYVSLPGVPREMRYLVQEVLVPILKSEKTLPTIYSHHILTQGIGESFIAEKIADLEDKLPEGVSLAYLPSRGLVKLRVTGRGEHRKKIENTVKQEVEKIIARISSYVFGHNSDTLAGVIGKLLLEQKATLSVAESLTGGSLGQEITAVSGSSSYFLGGVLAYHPEVKINELGVKKETIAKYSVVSEQVAKEMAQGALKKFNTTYAIATTGVAGPKGEKSSEPVGKVFIAVAIRDEVVVHAYNFGGDRSGIIRRTVLAALELLRTQLIS